MSSLSSCLSSFLRTSFGSGTGSFFSWAWPADRQNTRHIATAKHARCFMTPSSDQRLGFDNRSPKVPKRRKSAALKKKQGGQELAALQENSIGGWRPTALATDH